MGLGKIIVAGVIASVAIFLISVIQNKIISMGGWTATFTGIELFVAPLMIGAVVFIGVLEKLD